MNETLMECTPCPVGTFTGTYGEHECTPCPLNHFSNEIKANACTLCESDTRTTTEGATECTKCPFYQFDMGDNQCKRAKIRMYLTPCILLSIALGWMIHRYRKHKQQKREVELTRRMELLRILRADGQSANERYQAPMVSIHPSPSIRCRILTFCSRRK